MARTVQRLPYESRILEISVFIFVKYFCKILLQHLFVFILNDLSHFVVSKAKLSDSFPGIVRSVNMA